MKRERRSAAFKRKVALEAIREKKTINEIASAFDVHPVQVCKWKKQLLEGIDVIFEFSSKHKKETEERAAIDGTLHKKIDRLTMELDWLKKSLSMPNMAKRKLIEPEHVDISISRQCALLGLARLSYYRKEASEDAFNLHVMRLIDEEYTRHPFLGSRKTARWLSEQGYPDESKKGSRPHEKDGNSGDISETKSE